MKIRTTKYIVKEGILNAHRNKLMSLASVIIVTASLLVFGIFLLFSFNLNNNIKLLNAQAEMKVFCYYELDDAQVQKVENAIKEDKKVKEYKKVSKKEAFEEAKKILEDKQSLLEGEDENFLPISFVIKLNDPRESTNVVEFYKKVDGVEDVKYSESTIQFIVKFTYWIQLISIIIIGILLVISMFIISNTIKLTVFARRKEINIMKYIGATDWFIRLPFIIEGAIIGFAGALFAFVLIGYGYTAIGDRISSDLLENSIDFIKIVKLSEVWPEMVGTYLIIGTSIGSLGSIISIRKYLHV